MLATICLHRLGILPGESKNEGVGGRNDLMGVFFLQPCQFVGIFNSEGIGFRAHIYLSRCRELRSY